MLVFNGSAYATLATRFSSPSGLTLEAVIRTTSVKGTKSYGGNGANNIMGNRAGDVYLGFGVTDGFLEYNHYVSGWNSIKSTAFVADGMPHHVAVTHDHATGGIVLYVDHEPVATGSISYSTSYSIVDTIGAGYNLYEKFDGDIEKVRMHNRALTQSELTNGDKSSCVVDLEFDETFGNVATATATNYNASLVGVTFTDDPTIYVSKDGNDNNPGTASKPKLTVNNAIDTASSGYKIRVGEGEFDITTQSGSYGTGGLKDLGKQLDIRGIPGKTVFLADGSVNTARDHHAVCTTNTDTFVTGIIFKVKLGGRTGNYSSAMIGYDAYTAVRGKYYNCAFHYVDGTPSWCYDNNKGTNVEFHYCAFVTPSSFQASYNGAGVCGSVSDSVFNFNMADATQSNCFFEQTIDAEYRTDASAGVYYGEHTWVNYVYGNHDVTGSLTINGVGSSEMVGSIQARLNEDLRSTTFVLSTVNTGDPIIIQRDGDPVGVPSEVSVVEEAYLPSKIMVTPKNDVTGWVAFTTADKSDIPSSIDVPDKALLKSRIAVRASGVAIGNADFVSYGETNITSVLTVKGNEPRADLKGRMAVRPYPQLWGTTKLFASDFEHLYGNMMVVQHDVGDMKSTISVRFKNKMTGTSEIWAVGESDIPSLINAKVKHEIPGTINVMPDYHMYGIVDIQPPERITEEIEVVKDAFVRSSVPKLNYGYDKVITAGYSDTRGEYLQTLMGFNIEPITNLFHEYKLEKVFLRLKFSLNREPDIPLNILDAIGEWYELGVTWRNKPEIGDLVAAGYELDAENGYIRFDITDRILAAKEAGDTEISFYMDTDEGIRDTSRFYSKEGGYAPTIEYRYFDDVVRSSGRADMDTTLNIVYRGNGDLPSSFTVKSYWNEADLASSIWVLQPGERESSLTVSRKYMGGSIIARQADDDDITASLSVRETNLDDLDSSLVISKRWIHSSAYVAHRYDMPSTLAVRVWGQYDLFSWGKTHATGRPGSIYVIPYIDFPGSLSIRRTAYSQIPSKLTKSEREKPGTIDVLFRSDLPGSLQTKQEETFDMASTIAVNSRQRPGSIYVVPYIDYPGRIVVRHSDSTQITGSILAIQRFVPSAIYVLNRLDIPTSLAVRHSAFSDIMGSITPSFPDMWASAYVRFNEDLDSAVAVRLSDQTEIPGSITPSFPNMLGSADVPYRYDMVSTIAARQADVSDLPSTLPISRNWMNGRIHPRLFNDITGSIRIRTWGHGDLDSDIYVLNRLDIPSKMYIVGAYMVPSSIQVRSPWLRSRIGIPAYDDYDVPSRFYVRLSDDSEFNASVDVKVVSDLPCSIGARGWVYDDTPSSMTVRQRMADDIESVINVVETSIIPASITARQAVTDTVPSSITVSRRAFEVRKGTINVLQFSTLPSSLTPRLYGDDEIPSQFEVLERTDFPGSIGILSRSNIEGSIDVRYRGNYDMESSITPKIPAHSDIPSSMDVIIGGKFNIPSRINISSENVLHAIADIIPPIKTTTLCPVVKDAYVREDIPRLNYGGVQSVIIGSHNGAKYRTLIEGTLHFLPKNVVIEKADLVFTLPQTDDTDVNVKLYRVAGSWTEYGVTWDNAPGVGDPVDAPYVIEDDKIRFDVTDELEAAYLSGETELGFYLLAENEDLGVYDYYYSRESAYQPYFEVVHTDATVWSFGRANMDSSVMVYHADLKEIPSRIEVTTESGDDDLRSLLVVNTQAFRPGKLHVNRPDMPAVLAVAEHGESEIPASLSVAEWGFEELPGSLTISQLNVDSYLWVPYRQDVPSEVAVRRSAYDELFSWGYISAKYRPGSVTVPHRSNLFSFLSVHGVGGHDMPSAINIVYGKIPGSITVKQSGNYPIESSIHINGWADADLGSVALIQKSIHRYLQSSIGVARKSIEATLTIPTSWDMWSKLCVRQYKDQLDIPSTIDVARRTMGGSLIVTYPSDINGTIEVNPYWLADTEMMLTVSRPDLPMTFTVTPRLDMPSTLEVQRADATEIGTKLTVSRPDLPMVVNVPLYTSLESSLTVIRSEESILSSQIAVSRKVLPGDITVTIPFDIPMSVVARQRENSDIESTITINRADMGGTIHPNIHFWIDSSLYVKAWGHYDRLGTMFVQIPDDLESSINVNRFVDIPSSIQILSGNLASKVQVQGWQAHDMESVLGVAVPFKHDMPTSLFVQTEWSYLPSRMIIPPSNMLWGTTDIYGIGSSDLFGSLSLIVYDDLPSTMGVTFQNKMTGVADFDPVGDVDLPSQINVLPASQIPCSITALKYGTEDITGTLLPRVYGDSFMMAWMNVVYRGNADLVSRLEVPAVNRLVGDVFIIPVDDSDLTSSIMIHEVSDIPAHLFVRKVGKGELASSIIVLERSNLASSIHPIIHNDLPSKVAARRSNMTEIPASFTVRLTGNEDITGSIQPRYGFDVLSKITARQADDYDMWSSVYALYRSNLASRIHPIIHSDRPGTITARQFGDSDLASRIFPIIHYDIPGSISARQFEKSQFTATITVRQADDSDLVSRIHPKIHYDTPGSISARQFGDLSFTATITVRQTDNYDMPSRIHPRYSVDIPGSISARQWADSYITAVIAARQFGDYDMPSVFALRRTAWDDLPSWVHPRYSRDIDAKMFILYRDNLAGVIEVITAYPYAFIM